MGTVWRALDRDLDRTVAIKELHLPAGVTAEEAATIFGRIEREARAAARLRHPGIVTVHDRLYGPDGRPWIVMEYVQGGSLADMLAERGRLEVPAVASIGLAILTSLRLAHSAGVVHRDVKPANVLLEGDRVVLTDFGIAAVEGDATLTQSGVLLGTPAFMAPEQVRGLEATPETDLWALGATLYAAVEGRAPFEGAGAGAVLLAIATQPPAPPVQAGPLTPVPTGLLQREPAARLSAQQAHDHLTALARDGRPLPRRTGPPPKPSPALPEPPPMAAAPPPPAGLPPAGPPPQLWPQATRDSAGQRKNVSRFMLVGLSCALVAGVAVGAALWPEGDGSPDRRPGGHVADRPAPSPTGAPTTQQSPEPVSTKAPMDPAKVKRVFTTYMTGLVTHDLKKLKSGNCPESRHRLVGFALNGMYVTDWKLTEPIDIPPDADVVTVDALISLKHPESGRSGGKVHNQWLVERRSNGDHWTCGWLNAKDPNHP
ncbi:serine/threonine protein kinase [Actinomadura namibiensis]|uniref:non-specific serine/threonine protein kinase n=2 Tax=Actinomadura TaxID=1988 RepID=A0A7W3LTZ4_ACTNM|nr:serine/threonine protein kinase [Actinomadura namibiensis]